MHLTEIRIENIRSIGKVEWKVPESKADGWHVIIGDNGSGKSSFLRSVALALIGLKDAASLRMPWQDWLRKGKARGSIGLGIIWDKEFDQFSGGGRLPHPPLHVGVEFVRLGTSPDIAPESESPPELQAESNTVDPTRHVWGTGRGWFCAAFGPYRRLSGSDPESYRISARLPKLARYISIFDERYTLIDCVDWLQRLKFESLEGTVGDGRLLSWIETFVNQEGFLPHGARLHEITSRSVQFVDGNGYEVSLEDLSDGYRSILSMTFELIRQLTIAYGADRVFDPDDPTRITCPGVVLIDEVDVHLHPAWQRQIGIFLRRHFPRIQFIVTTHSPLICQAADVGTVFRLPRPGDEAGGEMIQGAKLERLLYGNVLDAYGTEVFGAGVSRSEEAKRRRRRLAELNVKETRQDLTAAERREQEKLRGAMPTAAMARGDADDPNP